MEERCRPSGAARLVSRVYVQQHRCNIAATTKERGLPPWLLSFLRIPSDPLDLFHGYILPLWPLASPSVSSTSSSSSYFSNSSPVPACAFFLVSPSAQRVSLRRFVPPTRHPLRRMIFKPAGRWPVIVRCSLESDISKAIRNFLREAEGVFGNESSWEPWESLFRKNLHAASLSATQGSILERHKSPATARAIFEDRRGNPPSSVEEMAECLCAERRDQIRRETNADSIHRCDYLGERGGLRVASGVRAENSLLIASIATNSSRSARGSRAGYTPRR